MSANAPAPPWWNRLPAIFLYAFSVRGALAFVFMGLASWVASISPLLSPFGWFMRLAGSGFVFSALFLVVRESANGETDVPEIQVSDLWDDLIAPGLKATLLSLVLFAPAIFCAVQVAMPAMSVKEDRARMTAEQAEIQRIFSAAGQDPAKIQSEMAKIEQRRKDRKSSKAAATGGWLALAVGSAIAAALLYPLCFIVLAVGGSLRMALFPVVWVTILRQVFLPYGGLLLGLLLFGVVASVASLPFVIAGNYVPLLPGLLGRMVSMYFALCQAHLLGSFVLQYADRLGYTPTRREDASAASIDRWKREAAVAADGGRSMPAAVSGAGAVRVGTAAPLPQMWDGPAQGAPSESEISGLAARFSNAVTGRDGEAAYASAPLLVDAYWEAGQIESAHGVYRALTAVDADACLEATRQLRIAKELESVGDHAFAATAWRALALRVPDHAQAPRALFRCADCYVKAGREDWSRRALEILVERYPMSEVAGAARARLRTKATG